MKAVYTILLGLLLTACNTTPQIVPDPSGDSVIMKRLDHEIQLVAAETLGDGTMVFSYVLIAFAWAWKEWIRPSIMLLKTRTLTPSRSTTTHPSLNPIGIHSADIFVHFVCKYSTSPQYLKQG